jgi:hypothetical protein
MRRRDLRTLANQRAMTPDKVPPITPVDCTVWYGGEELTAEQVHNRSAEAMKYADARREKKKVLA